MPQKKDRVTRTQQKSSSSSRRYRLVLTKDIKYYAKQYEKGITGAAMSKPKDSQENRGQTTVDGRRTMDDGGQG